MTNTKKKVVKKNAVSHLPTQDLLEFSLDLLCSFDTAGRFLSVTAAAKAILGYNPCELIGKSYRELTYPNDVDRTAEALNHINAGHRVTNFENRFIRKDGAVVTLLWSAIWHPQQNTIYAVAKDVTQLAEERKKAAAYEQRLARAYKLAQIAWWEWDVKADEYMVSDELYQIYGLTKEQHPSFPVSLYLAMVHPEDLPKVQREMAQGRRQEYHQYEHRVIKPNGDVIYVAHYLQAVKDAEGNLIQLHGTTKDISRRKTDELKIKKSRRTLKTILNCISDGFFALDKNWRVTYWNPKAEVLLQQRKEDILEKNIWEVFKEAIPLKFYTEYHHAMHNQVPVHFEEYFAPRDMWFEVSAYPTNDVLAVYFRDITERKRQEFLLQQSHQRYETITKATFDAIWDFNVTTGELYKSPGFQELTGFDSSSMEVDVLFWKDKIHPDDLNRVLAYYQAVMASPETTWFQELRLRKKNGTYARVQDKGVVIRNEQGMAIRLIGALRDVTDITYAHAIEKLEREVLEMNADVTQPLQNILTTYLTSIEALHPGIACSLLLPQKHNRYHCASPQLPKDMIAAIEAVADEEHKAMCGTAALLKKKVGAAGSKEAQRYAACNKIAHAHGLHFCWAHTIANAEATVLATLTVYHKEMPAAASLEEKTIARAVHLIKNILEHHRSKEALQESNLRYQYVTKATSDTIWDWNLQTNNVVRGEGFTTFYGSKLSDQDHCVDLWRDIIHPDDRQLVLESISSTINNNQKTAWQASYRCRRADGTYAEVVDKGYVIRNEDGRAVRMVGALQDVTRQIEAERKIKLSEERLRLLFHKSPKPKWMYSAADWQIVEVNESALRLYGYTREEFLRLKMTDLNLSTELQQFYKQHQLRETDLHNIVRHVKKNREEFYIELTTHAIDLPNGKHFIVNGDDMTEKLELQHRLITEKVNLQKRIGQAVLNAQERERGEIGRELHDNVNQILTSAKLYQELSLSGMHNTTELVKKSIDLTLAAINENRKLSKRLSAPTLGGIKFCDSVQELVTLVQSTNPFELNLDAQILNNLEVHQDIHLAMYRILQEHLTNIQKYAQASCVDICFSRVDDDLVLKITDNGKGFDTTQKRSGIGISNMTMRAESLGGKLVVNSAPGLGCVLIVQLPV